MSVNMDFIFVIIVDRCTAVFREVHVYALSNLEQKIYRKQI